MKTPHLDNLINDLKAYDRNDMLSDDGRNQLDEYEAIKRALSLGDVVGQSEQFLNDNVGENPILYLLAHQTFDKIGVFYEEPSESEIFKIIEDKYGKKVINFEILDRENFKFNFDDGSNIELLLRDAKYVD